MWWHAPFFLVNRLVHLVEVAASLNISCSLHVFIERQSRVDVELAIVAPLVGVANLHGESVEFDECVHLGAVAHPGESCDVCSERLAQVVDELEHLLLAAVCEVFVDV